MRMMQCIRLPADTASLSVSSRIWGGNQGSRTTDQYLQTPHILVLRYYYCYEACLYTSEPTIRKSELDPSRWGDARRYKRVKSM